MSAVLLAKGLLREPATARLSDAISAPVVLTAQPLVRARGDLAACLRAVPFDLRTVAQWARLPEGVERIPADVVLVDIDDAGVSSDGLQSMSGHRLMKLLQRRLAGQPTALIVITHLDFTEIQYLTPPGIHALLKPEITIKALVREICTVVARMRQQHTGRSTHHTALDGSFPNRDRDDDTRRPPRPNLGGGRNTSAPDERGVWGIPDSLWDAIALHLALARDEQRRRVSDRQVLAALLRLHFSGCRWSALPSAWGSPSTICRRARAWEAAGVFERLCRCALESERELARVPWDALRARIASLRARQRAAISAPQTRDTP